MGRLLQCLLKRYFIVTIIFLSILLQSFQIDTNPYAIKIDSKLERFIGNSVDHNDLILTNLEEGENYRIYLVPFDNEKQVFIGGINKGLNFIGSQSAVFKAQKTNYIDINFALKDFSDDPFSYNVNSVENKEVK